MGCRRFEKKNRKIGLLLLTVSVCVRPIVCGQSVFREAKETGAFVREAKEIGMFWRTVFVVVVGSFVLGGVVEARGWMIVRSCVVQSVAFQDAMRLLSLMVCVEDSSLVRERMGCLVEAFGGKRELLSGQQVLLVGDSQQQYYL